ncbi:MAG: class I SAM-dependent methyltransferase [Calditrichaeota bacterium]|nr:class I SAM-dependent methyltransferase [Calditrichota bacterium]
MTAKEIDYDPIKAVLGRFVARSVWRRRFFFVMLGVLFVREWHVKRMLRRLAKERSEWEILDAGSGYGQYSHFMARHFPSARILGADVKREQIADCNWFAQESGETNCRFEVADLAEFRQPNTFDLALSVDVMEHVAEDEKVLANICESLKAEGYFLVATPRIIERRRGREHEVRMAVGEHVREGYAEDEFRDKLTRAGFRVLSMKQTYGPWGAVAWRLLQRIPMWLLRVSKGFLPLLIPYYLLVYLPAVFFMIIDMRSTSKGGGWLVLAQK